MHSLTLKNGVIDFEFNFFSSPLSGNEKKNIEPKIYNLIFQSRDNLDKILSISLGAFPSTCG